MSTIDHFASQINTKQPANIGTTDESPRNNRQSHKDALYSDPARRAALAPVNWSAIPAGLRERRQWIAWHLEWDGARWSKIPLVARAVAKNEHRKASSTDSRTWATFGYVRSACGTRWTKPRFPVPPAPGFVFVRDGGLLGIDLDKCRDPLTGTLSPAVVAIMALLPGYWEVSPSGTGIKGFFRGQLPAGWKRHKQSIDGGPEEVEIYDRGRYFCVTGQRLEGATADLTEATALPEFLTTYLPPRVAPSKQATAGSPLTSRTTSPRDYTRSAYPRAVRMARARGWLRMRDPAREGDGGDTFTFVTCGSVLVGFDLEFDDAFELLKEWNERCVPPWNLYGAGADSLERKLRESEKWTGGARGCKLAEREPARAEPPSEEPTADPTEACAATVAAEVLSILAPTGRCPTPRVLVGRKWSTGIGCAVPFGCHRGDCSHCGREKRADLFKRTAPYLTRLTAPDGGMKFYARVVTPGEAKDVKTTVSKAGGKFLVIGTTDPAGCLEDLRQGEEEGTCLNFSEGVLALVLLPATSIPDPDLIPTTLACAFRAMGNALTTTPPRSEGVKRYRAWNASHEWGDAIAREPGDFQPDGIAILKLGEIKAVVQDLGIVAAAHMSDATTQGKPVGWNVPPAARLALSLLFRGVDRPEHVHRPTVERITSLAGYWLKALPADLGDGPDVEKVLRRHLWYGPPWGLIDELRAADEIDRREGPGRAERRAAEARMMREGDQLMRSLRCAYSGRKRREEAPEFVKMLLA